jgi:hypothetical protein
MDLNIDIGQSLALKNGALTVTRLSETQLVLRETGGDQMWLIDRRQRTFAEATDTDKNGSYDALLYTHGDPHVATHTGVSDITNAQSLAAHLQSNGLTTEYDVQTNYVIKSNTSTIAMEVVKSRISDLWINAGGTIQYQANDGSQQAFSLSFNDGEMVSFSDGATHTAAALASSGAPTTQLAWNPLVDDHLYAVQGAGEWARLAQGTFIDHTGAVIAGGLQQAQGGAFEAQARSASLDDQLFSGNLNAAYAEQMTSKFTTPGGGDVDDDETDDDEAELATNTTTPPVAANTGAPGLSAFAASGSAAVAMVASVSTSLQAAREALAQTANSSSVKLIATPTPTPEPVVQRD